MKRTLKHLHLLALATVLAAFVWAQSDDPRKSPGAGHDVASGAGDVALGPAKGAGSIAKGTAKGVGDLVTLHPIGAATSVGKGTAGAGKDIGVGAVKGTGKMARGVGKVFKRIL